MTTYEHAMLGITGTIAAGLTRRHGWRIAAMAAVAAICPDWDAATIVLGAGVFADGHRVWGHSLFAAIPLGGLIGLCDYRWDLSSRLKRQLGRFVTIGGGDSPPRSTSDRTARGAATWIAVGAAAAASHLAADLIVSGGTDLSDWRLQLLWPASRRGWVYPLVRWGDPGMTIVFVVGMFAMIRWPSRSRSIAAVTLLCLATYIGGRGWQNSRPDRAAAAEPRTAAARAGSALDHFISDLDGAGRSTALTVVRAPHRTMVCGPLGHDHRNSASSRRAARRLRRTS